MFEADCLKSATGLGRTDVPECGREARLVAVSAAHTRRRYVPPLAHVLSFESGPAVDWLCQRFGLDLSQARMDGGNTACAPSLTPQPQVSRLGGHSQPRTHRGGAKFPGFTITYALLEKLEEAEGARAGGGSLAP